MKTYPEFCVLHVPHNSTNIPSALRHQFCLTEEELTRELVNMTDWHTRDLFAPPEEVVTLVEAKVSRLVVDVERFSDDQEEVMSQRGMGAVYTRSFDQKPLRFELSEAERKILLERFYFPHHRAFELTVQKKLNIWGKCLIIDCHSFPSRPLPYELDQSVDRPDICLGTDSFHTPESLLEEFLKAFQEPGFRTKVNAPFSGAIVPLRFYQTENAVQSIMVEVSRSLYLDESTGLKRKDFDSVAAKIRSCCRRAIAVLKMV